jgi:hypothetical protein
MVVLMVVFYAKLCMCFCRGFFSDSSLISGMLYFPLIFVVL